MFRCISICLLLFCALQTGWSQNSFDPEENLEYRRLGLNFGSSAVYKIEKGFATAGFLEATYVNFAEETKIGTPSGLNQELGLARGVLYSGYRFNDRLLINTELRFDRDLRDGSDGNLSVDSAYLEYAINKNHSIRGGVILVPMGMINEFHGPQEFVGTHRDFGEVDVIPTNWHAVGVGLVGRMSHFDYRVFVINGLNAAGFRYTGTRESREISSDTIQTPAFVFRTDAHVFKGGLLGGSYYVGNSGVFGGPQPTDLEFHTVLMEAHGEVRRNGWLLRAQYSKALVDHSTLLNLALQIEPEKAIGSRMVGGYVEGGFNFLRHREDGTRLMPYARYEARNPQDAVPQTSIDAGFQNEHTVDQIIKTIGVEVAPISRLLIKVDFQHVHSELVDVGVNHFNIGMSYLF